jgi:hypothetical protein
LGRAAKIVEVGFPLRLDGLPVGLPDQRLDRGVALSGFWGRNPQVREELRMLLGLVERRLGVLPLTLEDLGLLLEDLREAGRGQRPEPS